MKSSDYYFVDSSYCNKNLSIARFSLQVLLLLLLLLVLLVIVFLSGDISLCDAFITTTTIRSNGILRRGRNTILVGAVNTQHHPIISTSTTSRTSSTTRIWNTNNNNNNNNDNNNIDNNRDDFNQDDDDVINTYSKKWHYNQHHLISNHNHNNHRRIKTSRATTSTTCLFMIPRPYSNRKNIGWDIIQQQQQQLSEEIVFQKDDFTNNHVNTTTNINDNILLTSISLDPSVLLHNTQNLNNNNHNNNNNRYYKSVNTIDNNEKNNSLLFEAITTKMLGSDVRTAPSDNNMNNNYTTKSSTTTTTTQNELFNNKNITMIPNDTKMNNNNNNNKTYNEISSTNQQQQEQEDEVILVASQVSTIRPNSFVIDHDGDYLSEFDLLESEFFERDETNLCESDLYSSTDHLYTCAIDWDNIQQPYISRLDSLSTFLEYTDDGSVVVPAGKIGQWKETVSCFLGEPIVEVMVCSLVVANCFFVALSTLPSLSYYIHELLYLENIIGTIFAIEVIGRWWSSSDGPYQHIVRPQFTIDVIVVILPLLFSIIPSNYLHASIVPDWLISPSTLFNLKLLRLLRFRRVLQDKTSYAKFEIALGLTRKSTSSTSGGGDFTRVQDWQLQLGRVLLSLFTLLSVATGMIYTAEHEVNPAFTDYFTTLYFGLTTLTTVGFGDITPVTWQGRLVVSGAILAGIAVIPAQAAALIEALLARQDSDRTKSIITTSSSSTTGSSDRTMMMSKTTNISTISTQKDWLDPRTSNNNKVDSNEINENRSSGSISIDTVTTCSNCNATMHWSNAKYCWSCGSPLS